MDKFLIKTPRNSELVRKKSKQEPFRKQTTLESLPGVVVIDDILRCKSIIELDEQNADEIITTLLSLKEKNPSKEILKSTGIGKAVHKLCRHHNEDIARSAKSVYEKWKTSVVNKATKPLLVVKSDLKTENFRLTARKWLLNSLQQDQDKLAELIEREAFQFHKRLVNSSYRKSIRRIVFALKNEDFRTKIVSRNINTKTLISTHCKL